jgi:hypothetical protein
MEWLDCAWEFGYQREFEVEDRWEHEAQIR